MSVRKVSNRGGNIVGKFPSLKTKRMVQFESTVERDYLYLLDYEADVIHFEDQPLTIEYRHEGKLLRYTPDFLVVKPGQHILIECKPQALVSSEGNQLKIAAAHEFAVRQGWQFRVVTDVEIHSGSRLRNIKLLRQCACLVIRAEVKGWVYSVLQNTPLTIAQVQAAVPIPPAETMAAALHMAYHHELAIPLDDGRISVHSPVSWPRQTSTGGMR